MNNHHSEDDPYFRSRPTTRMTSRRNNNAAYQVYTQELPNEEPDEDDNSPTVVEPGNMNSFMDDYLRGAGTSSSSKPNPQKAQQDLLSRQKADEDLATLLEETADMSDIQVQIEAERSEMASKYREDATRQRRAAAARSRYQRMTENERRAYNQRRRLKSCGADGSSGESDATRSQIRTANAKKAEAARQRYHKMTPEQKKDYNHRRTEAFRRRRMQEEELLATPAGQISSEALAKAQQIMVRNAKKAQSARMRYQRMTPDERRAYNLRRASKKKKNSVENNGYYNTLEHVENGQVMMDDMQHEDDAEGEHEEMGMGDLTKPNHIHFDPNYGFEMASEEHMVGVIDHVARPPKQNDVFAQMELDVIKRTKKAQNTILQHYKDRNTFFETMDPEECYPAETARKLKKKQPPVVTSTSDTFRIPNLDFLVNSTNQMDSIHAPPVQNGHDTINVVPDNEQRVIDEQALHKMVETGYDATGMPVEVRTADGEKITNVQDLLSRNVYHGQTVLITSRVEAKPATFDPMPQIATSSDAVCQDNQVGSTTSSHLDPHYGNHHPMDHDSYYGDGTEYHHAPDGGKQDAIRARRAERARARYHRMSEEQRRVQNARRAATLREARARDDELLKLGESRPLEELDEKTANAIREAQERRHRRAEQARNKYRRMTEEERRIYNSARDAVRKMKRDNGDQQLAFTQVPHAANNPIPQVEEVGEDEEDPTTPSSPIDPDDASSFFYGMFPPKNQ